MSPPLLNPTTRYLPPGVRRVYWVPSIANLASPGRAELDAGIDLTWEVVAMSGWSPTASAVQVADFGARFTSELPGRLGMVPSSITFPLSADSIDVRSYLKRGAGGFIAILWEGEEPSGALMDVYPVRVISPAPDAALENAGLVTIGFAGTQSPALSIPIPVIIAPPVVVTLIGGLGTFGTAFGVATTASGHTFTQHPTAGWQVGKGLQLFYSRATPDGQLFLSTLPLTGNELKPTMDHAEIEVYNPVTDTFTTIPVPTSLGATTAVTPGSFTGGTDTGAGDVVLVTLPGTPGPERKILTTQAGYYFNWNLATVGEYPVLAYFKEVLGSWVYDQGNSLTGDQWEATNPTLFGSVIAPGGQTTGTGGNYWNPRSADQMAVLPQSGNVVIGGYFGTGTATSGYLAVITPTGQLVAGYQIPNITPISGTITLAAVRDVEADPTSPLNDERFVIIYDAFGTGVHGTFQEFSYNQSTQTITPKSVPCYTGDSNTVPQFCLFGPDGTLYVSCGLASNGIVAGNLSVYLKHASGERNTVLNAPAGVGWQTGTWPTPVAGDFSLGFPRALGWQGIGGLAGPMAFDVQTGTLLVPSITGKLGNSIATGGGPGPNLLTAYQAGFEPPNLLTDNDFEFTQNIGSWAPFLGSFALQAPAPVAPPAGANCLKATPFSNSLLGSTGLYPWAPGKALTLDASFLAATTGRQCDLWVTWYNASAGSISSSAKASVTDNTTTWTTATLLTTGNAPAGTAFFRLWFQCDSVTTDVHYVSACYVRSLDAGDAGWTGFATFASVVRGPSRSGQFSLAITAPFNNEILAVIGPMTPVQALQEYLITAYYQAQTVGQTCNMAVDWYTGPSPSSATKVGRLLGTVQVTDATSGWAQAQAAVLAPLGARFAQVILEPTTSTIGETHYCDDVSFTTQPYTSTPICEFGFAALSPTYPTLSPGRPSIIGRTLYIPISNGFTSAELAAYNASPTTYVPAAKPQFIVAINLSALLPYPIIAPPPLPPNPQPAPSTPAFPFVPGIAVPGAMAPGEPV